MQASTLSCLEYSFIAYRCAASLKKDLKLEPGRRGGGSSNLKISPQIDQYEVLDNLGNKTIGTQSNQALLSQTGTDFPQIPSPRRTGIRMGWKPPASSKTTRAKVRGQRRKTKKTREM
jgi:hypothetical protein